MVAVAALSVSVALADASVTNRWTGGAGDHLWSSAANWENANTSCVYDFSALGDGETVTNDVGKTTIFGLVFGAGKGTVTLVSKTSSDSWVSGDGTAVVVPPGTTVDFRMGTHANMEWSQKSIAFRGGGIFKLNGYFNDVTSFKFYIYDSTFVVGDGMTGQSPLTQVHLKSEDAIVAFEKDWQFGRVFADPATIHPTVQLNGHVCGMRVPLNVNSTPSFNAVKFVGPGTINTFYGTSSVLAGGFGEAPVSFALEDGELRLGSAASPLAAPAGSSASFARNSRLTLYASQNLSSITATSPEGSVFVPDGATLTVAGAAATTDEFAGYVTGGGGLTVSGGSGYTLALSGANDYTGATRVATGTLRTVRKMLPRNVDGLIAYWDFAADSAANGAKDISSDDPLVLSAASGTTPSVSAAGGIDGGACLDCASGARKYVSLSAANNSATAWNRLMDMTNDYSIVMWLKPDPTEMNAKAGAMDILYNYWDNEFKKMLWIFFSPDKREIRFGGLLNTGSGYRTMTIPSGIDMFDGAWHQLVLTYRRSTRLAVTYLDGSKVAAWTLSHDHNFTPNPITFGYRNTQEYSYSGGWDAIQLWSRPITAEEVADNWRRRGDAVRTSAAAKPPAPVCWWTFDDATDPGRDLSGNGFNLASQGDGFTVRDETLCPGVNGKAVQIANGSWFELIDPGAPFPSGKTNFTVILRSQDCVNDGNNGAFCNGAFRIGGDIVTYNSSIQQFEFVGLGRNKNYYTQTYLNWTDSTNVADPGHFHVTRPTVTAANAYRTAWHTWAVVWDQTNSKGYVYCDGVRTATCSWNNGWVMSRGIGANADFYIGRWGATGSYFPEIVDECRVYAAALSAEQIAEISREFSNANGASAVTDNVLPATTDVTVDSGATLALGANQTLASVSGAGTVALDAIDLTLTGASAFSGAVTGSGFMKATEGSSLSLTGDGTGWSGKIVTMGGRVAAGANYSGVDVAVEEGAVFDVTPVDAGATLVAASGTVTLPSVATVRFSGELTANLSITVASGASVAAPADFSGWTVEGLDGRAKVKFSATATTATLSIKRKIGIILEIQ